MRAGPYVLDVVRVPDGVRDHLLLKAARLVPAVSLMGVALRFPVRSLRPVLLLVAVVMPLAALVTGDLAVAPLGLPVSPAMLLGRACSARRPAARR